MKVWTQSFDLTTAMKGLVLQRFIDVEAETKRQKYIAQYIGNQQPVVPYTYKADIPKPQLKPGLLLVRVKWTGFCHTDLIVANVSDLLLSIPPFLLSTFPYRSSLPFGDQRLNEASTIRENYNGTLPMIPGHENVGIVKEIGEGVSGFQVGDRVGTSVFRASCGAYRL
jgi:NADPH:quinone reductase-like Zn-dependent oxidoreductase